MIKTTIKAALALGALLVSVSSFAVDVDKTVRGSAKLTRIESSRTYDLTCEAGQQICYRTYVNDDIAVYYRNSIIWCRPAVYSNSPVWTPDPLEPGAYTMHGNLTVELDPGQQLPVTEP